jgi:hypothetical protein
MKARRAVDTEQLLVSLNSRQGAVAQRGADNGVLAVKNAGPAPFVTNCAAFNPRTSPGLREADCAAVG